MDTSMSRIAMDTALSGSLPWPLVVELATDNRLLLSTLESPAPSLFIMFKLFHISVSPI